MSAYPYLVDIAWQVVEQFIKEWKQEPLKWYYERDIQREIASRLSTVYKFLGKDTIEGNKYSKVGCENVLDGKSPDIVIWDESQSSEYTALWVCEIKLNSARATNDESDIKKIQKFLKDKNAKYGCWLNFIQKTHSTPKKDKIIRNEWEKKNNKFWLYRALPNK